MSAQTMQKIERELYDLSITEKLSLVKRILATINIEEKDKAVGYNFSKYRGIYKNVNVDWKKEIKEIRDEWERNF
jgi:Cdc6-like AAA superfamily ATPase